MQQKYETVPVTEHKKPGARDVPAWANSSFVMEGAISASKLSRRKLVQMGIFLQKARTPLLQAEMSEFSKTKLLPSWMCSAPPLYRRSGARLSLASNEARLSLASNEAGTDLERNRT
eukprot:4320758-Pleurochrysis_carterae.AAC.3